MGFSDFLQAWILEYDCFKFCEFAIYGCRPDDKPSLEFKIVFRDLAPLGKAVLKT